MKTGSPLDKLDDLIPKEISIGRPGPRRRMPIRCCANCQSLSKKAGDRYECHPKGSWFIKEIKGGEISVNMPHQKPCFSASVDAYSEFGNDPWNATADGIQNYLTSLEYNLRRLKIEDWESDNESVI